MSNNKIKGVLEIYPSTIDNTNFRYIKIDDKYVSSLVIYDYPKESTFTEIMDSFDKNHLYDMSIYIEKMNTVSVLKDLTYHISSSATEIRTANKNQIDIDILNQQNIDSKKLRKDIQLKNEGVYKVNIFLSFYNHTKNSLMTDIKEFQSKLYSKQIYSNITNFRNLESYTLNLPINNYENKLLEKTFRNITTSALSNFFPFYTNTVFDKDGIIFGYTNKDNRICNIDIFSKKYLNSNMIVFGSSGSGKSYFTKLIILKHYFKSIPQIIFDPEGEYVDFIQSIGGNTITLIGSGISKTYNILEITKEDICIDKNSFLSEKVNEIISFISILLTLEKKEKEELRVCTVKAYNDYGITEDINSVYKNNKNETVYIKEELRDPKDFPTLKDVIKNIKTKKLKDTITNEILNKYKCICNHTNIDKKSKLLVIDTSNLDDKALEIFTNYAFIRLNRYIEQRKPKSIIYIDEVWKYIRLNKYFNLSNTIYSFYKSIRKNNSSIITITQDISDFFMYKNGIYGKSILNNAGFKVFFKFDYCDKEILEKLNVLKSTTLKNILRLNKTNCILMFSNNTVSLNIKSNKYEGELIEGVSNEDFNSIR